MPRIALNGRLLVPDRMEGIGKFSLRCYRELVQRRPNDSFLLIVDRPKHERFNLGPNVKVIRHPIPGRRPWLLNMWFGWPMTLMLKLWRADALVSLEGPVATKMPEDFRQFSVIHDLNFEHQPQWLPPSWAAYYRSEFPRYARLASLLGTVSEFSKVDLVKSYRLQPERIVVIPNAADPVFAPLEGERKTEGRKLFSDGRPYLVFVGSMHERKNLQGLLMAFEHYVSEGGQWDLVLVGAAMWKNLMPAKELSEALVNRVHAPGRLNHSALAMAVASAEGMVFVPWFEGFGIPIVEAMASGLPVIASNVTSLPEVSGGAAYALVNPNEPMEIGQALLQLEQDDEGRRQSIARGLERAKDFSWANSGELLNRAVDQMLSH